MKTIFLTLTLMCATCYLNAGVKQFFICPKESVFESIEKTQKRLDQDWLVNKSCGNDNKTVNLRIIDIELHEHPDGWAKITYEYY